MRRTRKILLNEVANSILLYRAPIWHKACDLLAQERELLYERSKKEKVTIIIRQQERRWVFRRRHMRWGTENTKILITNIKKWVECKPASI